MKGGPRIILLVEDDPADQLMVQRALEESPIESRLYLANDGVEALEYLERCGAGPSRQASPLPHLVLVDLNMPGLPGREVVRTLRADPRFKSLPIVVLTTSADPEDVAESYALGVNSYIVKPTKLDELRHALDTLQEYWFRVVELPPAA